MGPSTPCDWDTQLASGKGEKFITDKENELITAMYSALKRGDTSECRRFKEEKGLSRRQRKRIKDEAIARIASSPLSNKMIEPNAVDVNALDCILEIGMLAKIFQSGLIDDDDYAKTRDDVLKRYGMAQPIVSLAVADSTGSRNVLMWDE